MRNKVLQSTLMHYGASASWETKDLVLQLHRNCQAFTLFDPNSCWNSLNMLLCVIFVVKH